jgi:CRP-like cAMP-binding protein
VIFATTGSGRPSLPKLASSRSRRASRFSVELKSWSTKQMFVSHILTRSARVEEDLVDQLFNSTEKRLARLLLLLANFGKEGRPEPVVAKISQEILAEMIGTTRSRVSHFMNKFRKAGFIEYNGHLEVHSSLLSVVLADPARSVDLSADDRQSRR